MPPPTPGEGQDTPWGGGEKGRDNPIRRVFSALMTHSNRIFYARHGGPWWSRLKGARPPRVHHRALWTRLSRGQPYEYRLVGCECRLVCWRVSSRVRVAHDPKGGTGPGEGPKILWWVRGQTPQEKRTPDRHERGTGPQGPAGRRGACEGTQPTNTTTPKGKQGWCRQKVQNIWCIFLVAGSLDVPVAS